MYGSECNFRIKAVQLVVVTCAPTEDAKYGTELDVGIKALDPDAHYKTYFTPGSSTREHLFKLSTPEKANKLVDKINLYNCNKKFIKFMKIKIYRLKDVVDK